MKITPLAASLALLQASTAVAQATTTTAAARPSCTATLISSFCTYPEPGPEFAIAADGAESCWQYCNANQPCDFVIFAGANPTTNTGTCWVYPGQQFDADASTNTCGSPHLDAYSKPVCVPPNDATPSSTAVAACAATASPSAIAEVCGYPAPGDCFEGCTASTGASDCLSQCASAADCAYVVFNARNPSNSAFASGTCWMYTSGSYDAGLVAACDGTQQFVYENKCPKPSPAPASSAVSGTASGIASSAVTGTVSRSVSGAGPGSTPASGSGSGSATAAGASSTAAESEGAASSTIYETGVLALGLLISMWRGAF